MPRFGCSTEGRAAAASIGAERGPSATMREHCGESSKRTGGDPPTFKPRFRTRWQQLLGEMPLAQRVDEGQTITEALMRQTVAALGRGLGRTSAQALEPSKGPAVCLGELTFQWRAHDRLSRLAGGR